MGLEQLGFGLTDDWLRENLGGEERDECIKCVCGCVSFGNLFVKSELKKK